MYGGKCAGSSSFTSGRNTERERSTREEKAEEEAKKAEEEAKAERDKSMSLQPGVAVGTMDPQDDEKVVYLTFDDGPSANTQRVLDILDQYDAKATFFITAQQPDYFPMIKKVYDEDIQLDFTAIRMNMIRSMHLWMLILMILRK